MYLHDDLIKHSFERLAERTPKGKKGMERTSCLMYFLAFDHLSYTSGEESVLCSPVGIGLDNRQKFSDFFCNLVRIGYAPSGNEWYVSNLGTVNTHGKRTAAQKFSGDFLTVPLKKASEAETPQGHPKRPKPLLLLGVPLFGKKWGIEKHPEWRLNLVSFLNDRITTTPWTDLAIFVLRIVSFHQQASLQLTLETELNSIFSPSLVSFWHAQINSERKRFTYAGAIYQEQVSTILASLDPPHNTADIESLRQENDTLRKEIANLRAKNKRLTELLDKYEGNQH